MGRITLLEIKRETFVYYRNEEIENQKKCYKSNLRMTNIRLGLIRSLQKIAKIQY